MAKSGLVSITINIELTPTEALALAQFAKRSIWDTFSTLAVDEAETREMIAAIEKVRTALAEEGFSPR
jgi:hypothetical protein